jgi:hypothetical protein
MTSKDDKECLQIILQNHKKAIEDLYQKIHKIIEINNRNGANIAECMTDVFERLIALEPNKPH